MNRSQKVKQYLAFYNVVMAIILCFGFGAFWSNASRLTTDPSIFFSDVQNYSCENGTTPFSDEYTQIAVQTMLLDYIRCVFSLFTLPATFIWYSYYFEDIGASNKYHGSTKSAILLVILALVAIIVSIASNILFWFSNMAYNMCGSAYNYDKIGSLGFALFVCTIINCIIWFISLSVQKNFLKKTNDHMYSVGCKMVCCAACKTPQLFCCFACSKKTRRTLKEL